MRLTQEAIAELKALEDRRGRLTPEQVVEAARPEDSVLHPCFEWDDTAAAESYRIGQARELLKRVKIEVTIVDRTFRTVAYVRDPDKEPTKPGYQNTLKVTARGAAAVLRSELEAISADMARAIGLAYAKGEELPGLGDKIKVIKAQVDKLVAGL